LCRKNASGAARDRNPDELLPAVCPAVDMPSIAALASMSLVGCQARQQAWLGEEVLEVLQMLPRACRSADVLDWLEKLA
jgi:hypothetical protein